MNLALYFAKVITGFLSLPFLIFQVTPAAAARPSVHVVQLVVRTSALAKDTTAPMPRSLHPSFDCRRCLC